MNTDLDQNRHDHIAYCKDNQYHALRKNIPADSEFLFGDDLPKRMLLQIKSSFLHLELLFNHITPLLSSKNFRRFPKQDWSIPETIQQQSQQQISQTKETLKLVGPLKFYNNILTELQKDKKNFERGNLVYFSKNWYIYTKNTYILDIITNGLKLDLKQLPT